MNCVKVILVLSLVYLLGACTTGHLVYINPEGETKTACETEYSWDPSVDRHAVDYVLSHCAKQAVAKGNTVVDKRLLTLDTALAKPPQGTVWTFELATQEHKAGRLTDKEYGYLVAAIDLGLVNND